MVHFPAKIPLESFVKNVCGVRGIHDDVVLETLVADVAHQTL